MDVTCANCGTVNPAGAKFCGVCGRTLASVCSVCGTANEPRFQFCVSCGSALQAGGPGASAPPPAAPGPATREAPISERRLVSILFADLVGFTTLSESRDPDEVRDLLSRYFDSCSQLIGRYGGTVEKFIGDAVMAVWGTPVAQEDDAERAVRAALDLTSAVAALGEQVGADLKARAGVLTGEASVTLGAEGQGMVAGDLVNTASRVQSVAPAGGVYVDDATRRSTEAAIVYEDAGAHELKGKAEPVQLYCARRVIGFRRGALRSEGLEAPFVGRDRELRLVKDLFHASAEERRAQLLLVSGIAGIGKSRLSWEFAKYGDGLMQTFYLHRGRCPAYGEGVTYSALADMVRGRVGIAEGDPAEDALDKVRTSVQGLFTDEEERDWVESRLAHLLGLEDRTARDPEDLFGAWRRFFERLSEVAPTILIFEDMQWADPALLDFVEYLMNWSRSHPLFVLVLTRPELSERHPNWAAGKRGVTQLYLEPLSSADMEALLKGLVPGLPPDLLARVRDRAEGVPLYAVETVRMLLDQGLLVADGPAYRVTGPVEALDVPETLHALIAARLDGLPPEERTLLQDGAILGRSFSVQGLAAVTGKAEHDLEGLLADLVRKELLGVRADPRSPDRGQYAFLQDLVRKVAGDTLSTRERKARHLAAATWLQGRGGAEEPEAVEVLASHYLEAYRAAPDASDAPDLKAFASDALTQAGIRSESLAAFVPASRYYEQALELTDDPRTRAELHERLGTAALNGADARRIWPNYEAAIEEYREAGDERGAARATARLGDAAWTDLRLEEALVRMEEAYAILSKGEPDATLADVAASLGRMRFFTGHPDEALEPLEEALRLSETLQLPAVFVEALDTKALHLWYEGRHEESAVLMTHSMRAASDHDLPLSAFRAAQNLATLFDDEERYEEGLALCDEWIVQTRRLGYRTWEYKFTCQRIPLLVHLARWDEALAMAAEVDAADDVLKFQGIILELIEVVPVYVGRGDLARAEAEMKRYDSWGESQEEQTRVLHAALWGLCELGAGHPDAALRRAAQAMDRGEGVTLGLRMRYAWTVGVEAGLQLRNLEEVDRLLGVFDALPPGLRTVGLTAYRRRFGARVAVVRGVEEGVDEGFSAAVDGFRSVGRRFELGMALLEWGEWLGGRGRGPEAEPRLTEARGIFEELGAAPWIERVDGAPGAPRAGEVATAATTTG